MNITIDNYIVLWNPYWTAKNPNLIQVTSLKSDLFRNHLYMMSSGVCYVARRSLSREKKIAMMFIDFNTIVVRDRINPNDVHKEFLKIKEYRATISPDTEGADDGVGL